MKLTKQAQIEIKQLEKNTIQNAKYLTSVDNIQNHWYYKSMLSKKDFEKFASGVIDINQAQKIMIENIKKDYEKKLKKQIKLIENILNHEQGAWGKCEISWRKSNTWGNCPYGDYINGHDIKTYKSVTGCGYDKLSTLTAKMLNNDLYFMSYVMHYCEKHAINKNNIRTKLGYGINMYCGKPYFDGGVGVSCHINILKKLKCKVDYIETKHDDYIRFDYKAI